MKKIIRLTEEQLHNLIRESVDSILKENAFDYYRDAEDNYLNREKLPKGWDKFETEDEETIYTDPDGNQYVKDEYGKFQQIG